MYKIHNSTLIVYISGKAQKDEGRPNTSLSLLTKAEKLLTQLPMKWLLCPRIARSSRELSFCFFVKTGMIIFK